MFNMPVQQSNLPFLTMGTDGLVKENEFQDLQMKEKLLIEKLHFALEIGYRVFDVAEDYGTLSALVQALQQRAMKREDVRIIYKIMPEQQREALYQALLKAANVAGGYLDVVMLHEANDQLIVKAGLEVLQKLVSEKHAYCIGLSNTNHVELPTYVEMYPMLQYVQNEFTLSKYNEQIETLKFCRSKDIVYMGFGIIREMPENELLTKIAMVYKCTPAQVLLAWAHALGVLQIVGSSQVKNIQENWQSLQVSLKEEAVNDLTELAMKSLSPTSVSQTSQAVPTTIPVELLPFFQATRQLAQMIGRGEEAIIEQRKTAVILCWNELQEQLKKVPNDMITKGLMKWKLSQKTLPDVMNDLQRDNGFCSAPKYAPVILNHIDGFFKSLN